MSSTTSMHHVRPALLLLHGAVASAAVWPAELLALPGRALAWDLPGHGSTAKPGRRTVGHYADAVAHRIKLELEGPLVIAGHSLGGAIALELARRQLPGLRGVAILASAARLPVGPNLFDLLSTDFPAAATFIAKLSYAREAPQALREANAAETLRCGRATTTGDFLACAAHDLTAALPTITLPALFISGSADRMVAPQESAAAAAALPRATFHSIEGAGHTIMQEAPQAVAALLAQFLHEI